MHRRIILSERLIGRYIWNVKKGRFSCLHILSQKNNLFISKKGIKSKEIFLYTPKHLNATFFLSWWLWLFIIQGNRNVYSYTWNRIWLFNIKYYAGNIKKTKKLCMVLHKYGTNSKYYWTYIAPNNANAPT